MPSALTPTFQTLVRSGTLKGHIDHVVASKVDHLEGVIRMLKMRLTRNARELAIVRTVVDAAGRKLGGKLAGETASNTEELAEMKHDVEGLRLVARRITTDLKEAKSGVASTGLNSTVQSGLVYSEIMDMRVDLDDLSDGVDRMFATSQTNNQAIRELRSQIESSPSMVKFQVRLTNPVHRVSNDSSLKFDTIMFNNGDAYDEKSGVFTTPITGTYFMWVKVMFIGRTVYKIGMFKDGSLVAADEGEVDEDNLLGFAAVGRIISLRAGDEVVFKMMNCSDKFVFGMSLSGYGGCLYYED